MNQSASDVIFANDVCVCVCVCVCVRACVCACVLKESRRFAWRRRNTMKWHDKLKVLFHAFSTLALDEGECSASRPGRLITQ